MRDYLPPFRPDVAVLFGRELPRLGVSSDLLGQRAARTGAGDGWPAGRLLLRGHERPGLLGEILRPLHDFGLCWSLRPEHAVIQVRDKIRTGFLVRLVAALRGRPWTYWMSFPIAEGHAQRAGEIGGRGLLGWLMGMRARSSAWLFYRSVAPHADHVFVQSRAMLEFMAAKGIRRERMTAVPMGVDSAMLAAVRPIEERPASWRGRRLVAYLGALGRARDPAFLLESFARLREREPAALLLLIGDAPAEDERLWLRERIAASGLAEHIHLTGWLPQAQALRWLACAELAWSPVPRGPLFDVSSPTKAVEYLGLGIACIGNDIPDQREVLASSGGGLCVPMRADAFAEASARLLADVGAVVRMGRAGQAWVSEHRDYAVLARQVAAVYRRLAGSGEESETEEAR